MEANYDEDLLQNLFLKELQQEYGNVFKQAIDEGWIICVPRCGSFNKSKFTKSDFFNHILIPTKDSVGNHFRTLTDKEVKLLNKVLTIDYDIAKPCSLHLLFEEIFYTEDQKKYRIWCIERPLEQNFGTTQDKVSSVTNLRECMDLLWTEISNKSIMKDMKSCIDDYVQSHKNSNYDSLQSLRDSVSALYAKCLRLFLKDTRLREKTINCRYFLQLIKIAVETYVLYGLKSILMRCISTFTAFKDAALNKITKNLNELKAQDLGVRNDLHDVVMRGKFELSQLDKLDTVLGKVGCLKKTINCVSQGETSVSSDDLLPVLIFLVIKSGIPNWIAQLTFMKQFRFSATSVGDSDEAEFLITSLEAAIEYIKSGVLIELPLSEVQTEKDMITLGYLFGRIVNDDLKEVERILAKEKSLPDNDGKLCHPLCMCKNCEKNLAKKSRSDWPTVHSRDDRGLTPLHIACLHGQVSIVDFLINHKANVNDADADGTTPLHCACSRGHQNSLLLLLHAQADPNVKDTRGNAPLHLAADHGHDGCVKAILYFTEQTRTRLEVNLMNLDGDTALHHASKWGYAGIVEILLEYGADRTIKNRRGLSPLAIAHSSHVSRLLERKESAQSAIPILSLNHSPKSTPKREKIKKTVSFVEPKKESAKEKKIDKLLTAVVGGDIHLVSYYLGLEGPCGGSFDKEESRCHPLCNCQKCATMDEKSVLQEKKPEIGVNNCNDRGESALHVASASGYAEIVQLLLDAGANVNLRTAEERRTPLHLACLNDKIQVVRILLECGTCDVNCKDVQGDTPLHFAVRDANCKVTEILVRHGARGKVKNNRGESAMDEADAMKFGLSDAIVEHICRLLRIGDG